MCLGGEAGGGKGEEAPAFQGESRRDLYISHIFDQVGPNYQPGPRGVIMNSTDLSLPSGISSPPTVPTRGTLAIRRQVLHFASTPPDAPPPPHISVLLAQNIRAEHICVCVCVY